MSSSSGSTSFPSREVDRSERQSNLPVLAVISIIAAIALPILTATGTFNPPMVGYGLTGCMIPMALIITMCAVTENRCKSDDETPSDNSQSLLIEEDP